MRTHNLLRGPRVLIQAALVFVLAAASALGAASPVYRMSQLDDARKRAAAEGKPIAWIGTFGTNLAPYKNLMGKGSHAATQYAIRALQNDTILITSDSATENHREPAIVDHELHTPDPHYTAPVVVILTPSLDKVIHKILHIPDSGERVRAYTEALQKIRDKSSWQGKPAESDKEKTPPKPPVAPKKASG